eukprot:8768819-Pyramimonas_sp.AAC.1
MSNRTRLSAYASGAGARIQRQKHQTPGGTVLTLVPFWTVSSPPAGLKKREFDINKNMRRHVALEVMYLGWQYNGFAMQKDTKETVEVRTLKP